MCSKVSGYTSRFEKHGEVSDTIPSELSLQDFLGDYSRCGTCRRLYLYEHEYEYLVTGSEDTTSFTRKDFEEVFRGDFFIRYRLGPETVETTWPQTVFPQHSIAVLKDEKWIALHDEGAITPLDPAAGLAALIAIDPPVGLDDRAIATQYLFLVERMRNTQHGYGVSNFNHIRWKWMLTDEEKAEIENLRAISRVEREVVEELDDRVQFTRWTVLDRKLICRVVSVFPNGDITYEDAVIGENLPVDKR